MDRVVVFQTILDHFTTCAFYNVSWKNLQFTRSCDFLCGLWMIKIILFYFWSKTLNYTRKHVFVFYIKSQWKLWLRRNEEHIRQNSWEMRSGNDLRRWGREMISGDEVRRWGTAMRREEKLMGNELGRWAQAMSLGNELWQWAWRWARESLMGNEVGEIVWS